jgi:hypothetical protein
MQKIYLDYGRAPVRNDHYVARRVFRYAFKSADNTINIGSVVAYTRPGAITTLQLDPSRVTDKLKEIL